jgi:hypothetical protein
MMRFFFGLIAVLFIFQLTVSRAQALGQACCPDGRTWLRGSCMIDTEEICTRIMAPACVIGMGGAGTGAQTFPAIAKMCIDGGVAACQAPGVVTANVALGAEKACPVLIVSAINAGSPGAAASIPAPIMVGMVNACITAFNVTVGLDPVLTPAACADNETCVQNVCYEPGTYFLCNQATDQYKPKCEQCLQGGGIWTAIGCVEHSAQGITDNLLKVGLGIAGGLALLMILVAAFEFSVSQGDPKLTNEAKERLQAAVIGLLFIVFSVTILQFMGVTILHIPGFGT